jgi:lipoprotein-anchoring transpeptidase ErfK/SrfK
MGEEYKMKRALVLCALALGAFLLTLSWSKPTAAAGPQWILVNPGDTLTTIAVRHNTSVEALMRTNNLPNPNFVYSGQRLLVPAPATWQPPAAPANGAPAPQAARAVYYTVSPGDTLAGIAARFGVPMTTIAQANGLTNWNFVWYGQRLAIPGATSVTGVNPPPAPPVQPVVAPQPANPPPAQGVNAPAPPLAPTTGKWIDVNLSTQTITAYEGDVAVKTILVSTGTAYHPTVVGTFHILSKYPAVRMTGGTPGVDYYDLPNVPYTMFFFQGYAIHGTYWHHNFGHRMSHGCVNLPTDGAKWFYDWAAVGTPVVSHS